MSAAKARIHGFATALSNPAEQSIELRHIGNPDSDVKCWTIRDGRSIFSAEHSPKD